MPVIRRFTAPEATQGVAVDSRHFYAIGSAEIGKYDKQTGRRVAGWRADAASPILHLNGGVVVGGRLLCAHSNYPSVPMRSSIEVFDAGSLRPLETRPLPDGYGSATWIDLKDGDWWIAFAHYAGRGGEPGKGPEHTTLVRFDQRWQPLARWSFPKSVVSRWDGMSNSGGTWDGDRLITTGHHAPEMYVLHLSPDRDTLDLVEIVPVESEGQGIALDRTERLLYAIQRRTKQVLVSKVPE